MPHIFRKMTPKSIRSRAVVLVKEKSGFSYLMSLISVKCF